jgi:hypothetical protein
VVVTRLLPELEELLQLGRRLQRCVEQHVGESGTRVGFDRGEARDDRDGVKLEFSGSVVSVQPVEQESTEQRDGVVEVFRIG